MERKKRIPKRRFIEFLEAGEWEDFSFGSLVERKSTMITGRSLPILEYEDLISGSGELNKDITQKSDNKTGIFFQEGDIVYGKLRPYLKNWYLPTFAGIAVGDFWVFRSQNIAPTFIYGLIQTPKYEAVANKSVGTKMPRADWHVVSDTPFFLPMDYCEQKKIGDFCRRLDTLTSLHQQKLAKLKDLKQAYLTEMFPAPGEKRPRRRFKGFSGDWDKIKVCKICSISTGKSNTQDNVTDGKYPFFVRSPIVERSNKYLFDEEAVLTVGDGVGTGKVFHYVNGKYDLHQRVYRMYDFCKDINAKYFYHFFSNFFYNRVMSMTAKTSVDSVRVEMISDMGIIYPSLEEQIRISNLFDNVGNVIEKELIRISKLQSLKQAYLSELFV